MFIFTYRLRNNCQKIRLSASSFVSPVVTFFFFLSNTLVSTVTCLSHLTAASLRCLWEGCLHPVLQGLRAEGPSVGVPLSLLRRPQRLLIIPDLLAPLPFTSHSGPPWLTQVPLPTHFSLCLPPAHFQNNHSEGSRH